jgi:hypothetical protein
MTHRLAALGLLLVGIGLFAAGAPSGAARPGEAVAFRKTVVDREFRSEGVAVADVNRDGKPDILAGNFWYAAPAWKPQPIRPAQQFDGATGYSNSFLNFALDVNRDGWPDQVLIGFPGDKAIWAENPRGGTSSWPEHLIWRSACNESPAFADLLGNGQPVLVFPFDERQMAWYEPGTDPAAEFTSHLIGEPKAPGTQRFSHGLGVGDVNGDRRPDVLVTEGYWEAPSDPRAGTWKFVPAALGPACAQMHTYDVDGDGDLDVLSSSAHNIGVWWYEQTRGASGPEFKQRVIDDSFSQSHSLALADINRDGVMDLVTGKRFWAHGPNGDVRPGDPAVLYWFELKRGGGQVTWTRHEIDHDSGVGTQFVVTDVNGDGRLDVVTANKKGVFYFEQQGGA